MVLASIIITTSIPAMASANSSTSLINSARSHLGTKYVYGGTTTSGFDCSGFTQYVFKQAGISIPRTTGQQFAAGTPVSRANLEVGDLVFFNTSGRGVSHDGIYIGGNNFIHASSSRGVMISSLSDPYYWGSRYIGARRLANFNEAPKVSVTETKKPVAVATPKPAPVINYPTRAEIAETLVKELGLTATSDVPFKDVPKDHENAKAIAAVAEAGIFTGDKGEFNPDASLTRAHLSKILVESFALEGKTEISFSDVPANHWANEYISTLYHNEITTGYLNGDYGTNDPVTHIQFEKFISRIN